MECGDGQIQGPVSQESGARAGFHALGAWDATGSPIASGIDTSITVAAAVEPRVRDTFLGSAIRCNAANHSNRRGRPIRYRDRCRVSRCDRAAQAPTARAARSADQIQRHARGVAKVPGVTGRRAITRGRSITGGRAGIGHPSITRHRGDVCHRAITRGRSIAGRRAGIGHPSVTRHRGDVCHRAITRARSIAGRRVGNSRIATSRANVSIGSSRINRVRANTVPTVCAGICAGICASIRAGTVPRIRDTSICGVGDTCGGRGLRRDRRTAPRAGQAPTPSAAVSAGCWFRKPERRRRYGVACG